MSGRKQSPPERAAQIDAYIRAHYNDPGLGAALLSERLGLSTAYLSRLVRQQKGKGIVACIHEVRLEKARELLDRTELSINEVAKQTGFTNRRTLARAFQRYTGTSPGAYREREREGYKNQKNRP